MATSTQYNPNRDLNERLLAVGASKTVYALVTPQIEAAKATVFGDNDSTQREDYLDQFRDAWTAKQDAYHEEFFDVWHEWSKPVIDRQRRPVHWGVDLCLAVPWRETSRDPLEISVRSNDCVDASAKRCRVVRSSSNNTCVNWPILQ